MITSKHILSYSAAMLALTATAKPATQPNVIFILIDDMGWKDLGVYGSDFHQTPNIDQLAADGVRFTNGYSACTVSSPTRASVMTGKYPAKLRITDWIEGHKFPKAKLKVPDWTMYLPYEETTMAEVFKAAGYTTAHIGKWHLGEQEKDWPEFHGFDINIGGWAKGAPNLNRAKGMNGYFPPYGNPRLKDGPPEEYLTERLADEACNFLDNHQQSKPFFLNLWLYNVHTPLQAKEDKVNRYMSLVDSTRLQMNPVYAAMVEHVDDAVGQLIAKLKELGQYDNTIIVFTSDNGGLIANGSRKVTNNSPLRLGKGHIYEGGVRVPFFIKQVNQKAAGVVNHTPVISNDFLPTFVDMLQLPVSKPVQQGFDGVSLTPLLKDKPTTLKRKAIYWHYPHYHTEGATPYSAVRYGDWKLIHIIETNTYELYNLKQDIGETNNLAASHPKMLKKLTKNLENWKKEVKAQMPEVR
jgi:arylsulfatase A